MRLTAFQAKVHAAINNGETYTAIGSRYGITPKEVQGIAQMARKVHDRHSRLGPLATLSDRTLFVLSCATKKSHLGILDVQEFLETNTWMQTIHRIAPGNQEIVAELKSFATANGIRLTAPSERPMAANE